MSKHAPTFVFLAVITGTLIFCGATGIVGTFAMALFPLFVVLFLISLLGGHPHHQVSFRHTHHPFSGHR